MLVNSGRAAVQRHARTATWRLKSSSNGKPPAAPSTAAQTPANATSADGKVPKPATSAIKISAKPPPEMKKARSTPKSAQTSSSAAASPPVAMSLDGTIQVADESVKRKRLERAASMKEGVPHHTGLGGAMIRAVWEQDPADVSTNSAESTYLKTPKTVSILGAPMSWGQPLAGTDHGPALIRQAGLVPALKRAGWRVNEDKSLAVEPPTPTQASDSERYAKETGALAHNSAAVGSFLDRLSQETEAAAKRDEFVLTIGGDHSIACGSLAGILRARPDAGVIWVDAHADLHTPLTSESGNMHGMPVGILMSDDALRTRIPGFGWLKGGPKLRPEKIVYVGSRDLDQAERRAIKQKGILCFTMTDVDRWGIGQVMERVFKHLGQCPIHLSYDIDAVDAEYAPHTGTVVRGGFSFREANFIAESVAETNRLCSMDMVEINPSLGDPSKDPGVNETVQLGLTIIASAMGQKIL